MMTSREESAQAEPTQRDAKSTLPWKLLLIGGLLVAVAAYGIRAIRAGRLPEMTQVQFDNARSLWEDSKQTSYRITVEVSGMQPGVYDVTVENGIATAARFDGRPLTRQRTFGTWSVVGMFDTLSRDLETNEKAGYLMLGAEFDPQYGYPTKYQRIEMRTGAHDALQWKVTRFEPLP